LQVHGYLLGRKNLFTAITGCTSVLFGGVTLHSAVFLNSKSKLYLWWNDENWEKVRMLISDKIHFKLKIELANWILISIMIDKHNPAAVKFYHQVGVWWIFNYFLWRFLPSSTSESKRESIIVYKIGPLW
jgi:hypothetical protein